MINSSRKTYYSINIGINLEENINTIKEIMNDSSDLMISRIEISGYKCALLSCEGMVSTSSSADLIFRPIMDISLKENSKPMDLYNFIIDKTIMTYDSTETKEIGKILRYIMSGFVIILIDGCDKAVSLGIQGYVTRSVSEPTTESNIRGAQDGFVETVRSNMSLIRRRIKSPFLKFEIYPIGIKSKTDICIAYLTDKAPAKLVRQIKKQIKEMDMEVMLTSGYLEPFLDGKPLSLFSSVSVTQRPDVLCAKINEGRVAVIVDGTPFAIVTPALFIENFQTIDDYAFRPYYATYIRWIKYFAFLLAVLLPGFYVAAATFHPEMFSHGLLMNLYAALEVTPFSLFAETIIIIILFEIIKEAGIRLPKVIGSAVSIVGGLVIGDAAVSSGLISTPLLIIVGLTATSAFVIPDLMQQTSILRLLYIIAGGTAGFLGIALLTSLVISNITSMENFGIPYSAPLSPFTPHSMRDVIVRASFRRLQKNPDRIENLKGVTKYSGIEKYRKGGRR